MDYKKAQMNQTIVALDIGTTKVCAIAGRKDEHGKLQILGVGEVASNGVSRGVVSNIEKTVKAISDAIASVEKQINEKAGQFIHQYSGATQIVLEHMRKHCLT